MLLTATTAIETTNSKHYALVEVICVSTNSNIVFKTLWIHFFLWQLLFGNQRCTLLCTVNATDSSLTNNNDSILTHTLPFAIDSLDISENTLLLKVELSTSKKKTMFYLLKWTPFKNDEKCYFMLKALFVLKIFKTLF